MKKKTKSSQKNTEEGTEEKVKNPYLVALGEQIRELRKAKKWSQEYFANEANIDRSYMGDIERGERNVTFLTLVKIADQLGCDVSAFTKDIPK